jgi:hypothetical protein
MFSVLFIKIFFFKIEAPRKPNKWLEIFGSYIALPLMTIVLVISLLILFLLVKAYFSNSYIYAIQGNDNKSDLNIGAVIDTRLDQFRKPSPSNEHQQQQQHQQNQPVKFLQSNSNDHLIIKTLLNNQEKKDESNNQHTK